MTETDSFFNILEFGFRTKQNKSVTDFLHKFRQHIGKCTCEKHPYFSPYLLFLTYFGREITPCTSNHVPKTVGNY
jgi:hypothetical protein